MTLWRNQFPEADVYLLNAEREGLLWSTQHRSYAIMCANRTQLCIPFTHIHQMEHEIEFQLYQIAEDQGGYFSLTQARTIGLGKTQIYRALKRGKFEKATRGVYRFVQFPASQFEEIHAAVLSVGEHAVVGFQSALYVYDLSDIIPDEIHLILPATRSRRRPGIRVHTIQLIPENVTQFEGLPITTIDKTILDCAFAHVADEQIRIAVLQSLRRGMTTKQKLIDQASNRSARVQALIGQTVAEIQL